MHACNEAARRSRFERERAPRNWTSLQLPRGHKGSVSMWPTQSLGVWTLNWVTKSLTFACHSNPFSPHHHSTFKPFEHQTSLWWIASDHSTFKHLLSIRHHCDGLLVTIPPLNRLSIWRCHNSVPLVATHSFHWHMLIQKESGDANEVCCIIEGTN